MKKQHRKRRNTLQGYLGTCAKTGKTKIAASDIHSAQNQVACRRRMRRHNNLGINHRTNKEKKPITTYWPLVALLLVAVLGATSLTMGTEGGFSEGMHFFMGLTLCQFALLKLFHPALFVEGFQQYDLIAKRWPLYGYFYPLIELALGLAYLSFTWPATIYLLTIILMSIGIVGVVQALKKGLDVRCACMGSVLDVPLSTVTLSEDLIMAIMACLMLLRNV